MIDEKLLQLIADSDPVPDPATLHPDPGDETPLLLAIYQRGGIMGEMQKPTTKATDQPIQVVGAVGQEGGPAEARRIKRWTPVAAIASLVAVVSVGAVFLLASGNDVARPVIPDFSQDETLVGEALTAAYNSGDVDLFMSLFAADAQLEFSGAPGLFVGETIFPADFREYIEGWSRTINERWSWVDCQRTGTGADTPVQCQVTITNDWLELMAQEPDRASVTFRVDDGTITQWDHRGLRSPNDVTVAEFEDWSREAHPAEAARMWQGEGSVFPIFTKESARLHLRLGEEYLERIQL